MEDLASETVTGGTFDHVNFIKLPFCVVAFHKDTRTLPGNVHFVPFQQIIIIKLPLNVVIGHWFTSTQGLPPC